MKTTEQKPSLIDRIVSLFVIPDRERLRGLLVPELADIRAQLDQARRLAGEAQAMYREAANRAREWEQAGALMETARDRILIERDQIKAENEALRARVAELEADKKRSDAAWDARPFFQGDTTS